MGILAQEMKKLAQQAGGSHKTVHDRMALVLRFCERLLGQNVQIRRVEQLKSRHIEEYVRARLAQDITKRSLQNEMAAVRCILKQAGRDKLAQAGGSVTGRWGCPARPATGQNGPSRRSITVMYWKPPAQKIRGWRRRWSFQG
jgi:hypothetical protein